MISVSNKVCYIQLDSVKVSFNSPFEKWRINSYCVANDSFIWAELCSNNRPIINNPSNAQVAADDYSKLMKHCRKYKLNSAWLRLKSKKKGKERGSDRKGRGKTIKRKGEKIHFLCRTWFTVLPNICLYGFTKIQIINT